MVSALGITLLLNRSPVTKGRVNLFLASHNALWVLTSLCLSIERHIIITNGIRNGALSAQSHLQPSHVPFIESYFCHFSLFIAAYLPSS